MVFLAFSQFTARKHLAIFFYSSDYAQTYRMVAHSILEGGKTKIKRKKVVISILPLQNSQGLAGVDFSLQEILVHFSLSYFYCIVRLNSNSQYSRLFDQARTAKTKMDNVIGK